VTDLRLTDSGVAVAVGSRSQGSADRFADEFGIANPHASYESLVADPAVDVIYVATPHPMHHDNAILALRAGKHVLVEKPFTTNAAEAREIVRVARENGLFAMEAMWTRFLPHMTMIRNWLDRGVLGDVVTVTADHGQWFAEDAEFRLFAPELGGGALLDLGVYPVSFAVDGPRHAEPDRVRDRRGVHRRRRANVHVVRLPQRRSGRADVHPAGEESDEGGDRRQRREDRGRGRLLRSRDRDAEYRGRATRPASSRCTRAGACATRPTRSHVGWLPVTWRAV